MGAGDDVEQEARFGDAAGDRTDDGQGLPAAEAGGDGDQAEGGLVADHAAEGGGNADRAAAVGAQGHRHGAVGDRRTRPAAGATGDAREVERVAGDTEQLGLRDTAEAELGVGGAADDRGARVAQAADDHRVLGAYVVSERARAAGRAQTPHPDDVLDRDLEGTAGSDLEQLGEGVDVRLPGLDRRVHRRRSTTRSCSATNAPVASNIAWVSSTLSIAPRAASASRTHTAGVKDSSSVGLSTGTARTMSESSMKSWPRPSVSTTIRAPAERAYAISCSVSRA